MFEPKKAFESLTVKTLIPILRSVPLPVARSFGTGLASFMRQLPGLRREVTEKNIARAFPELDDRGVNRIASESYRFFTRAAVDWLRFEDVRESESIEIRNWEYTQHLQEHGGIIVTGHLGYWELAASELAKRLDSFTVYSTRQSNAETDAIIRNIRAQNGVCSVQGPDGLRELVRRAKNGQVVGIIGDQRPRNQHEFIEFFGDEVKNTRILSFVARLSGRPVVPIVMVRSGDKTIELKVFPSLHSSRKEVNRANRCELLREYNAWLEERIRKYPEQYFWFHRRWKGARVNESTAA